jgi:hypothetical protein
MLILASICSSQYAAAEGVPRAWLCSDLNRGSYMGAPDWSVKTDGQADQVLLVEYKGNNVGHISWFKRKEKYYDAPAIAVEMNSGIAFSVYSDEFLESYVLNVSTSEIFFTSIRSGSSSLPNAVKSFRGTCEGAG